MQPAVEISDVSVAYLLLHQRIPSLKEYLFYRLRGWKSEYREFWALKKINLTADPGQVVGIVGRNGSGKSTLLKVVSGIIRPVRGTVRVNGIIAPLIELGAGFDTNLTGRENIFLNGSLLGFTNREIASKFGRIVEFAELEEFIDVPLRTYSSGMVARLGFAIATEVNPDVLVIDEFLTVGDDAFQKKCVERIQSFRTHGVCILLVSHSLSQIRAMADTAIWLNHGVVVVSGDPGKVVAGYQEFMMSARTISPEVLASAGGPIIVDNSDSKI